MMKLACMSLSYQNDFRAGKMDLESFIETCYRLGLDGVDLHARSFSATDEGYLKKIKALCLGRGLPVACVCVSNNFGKPEAELPHEVETFKRWMDRAQIMGAPIVRAFGGWAPQAGDEKAAWRRMIRCLKEVAEYGEERGMVVVLQNHDHRGLIQVGDDVIRALRETESPYLSHVLDTGQYTDLYSSIEKTAPLAVHVRAKIYQIETGEERKLDYTRIFPILERVGYNGFVSIVYEGREPEGEAVPKAVKYLRRFIR